MKSTWPWSQTRRTVVKGTAALNHPTYLKAPQNKKALRWPSKWRIVISTQGEKALAKGMGATVAVLPEVSHCRRENSSILHPTMSHFKFRRIEDRARYQGKDNSSQSMNPLSQPYRTEVFLALFEKFLTSSR
jgi:hypothetical protein